jgi:hypothetical protein
MPNTNCITKPFQPLQISKKANTGPASQPRQGMSIEQEQQTKPVNVNKPS